MPNKQKWTMYHAQNLAIRITLIFSTTKKKRITLIITIIVRLTSSYTIE